MPKMIMGRTNTLEVARVTRVGLFLKDGQGNEVLLPKRHAPADAIEGSYLDVFVYRDSEDRPVATTQKPFAQVDEFAVMQVVEVTDGGAFLNWGLDKDLLLPFRQQVGRLSAHDFCVVRVLLDPRSERIVATQKLGAFFDRDTSAMHKGKKVELCVFAFTPDAIQVLVDWRYTGLLYQDQVHKHLQIGQILEGFVQAVRPDGKLDLSLDPVGFVALKKNQGDLLALLQEAKGFLPLHDNSSPEEIREFTGLSKKAFKKLLGMLWKQGKITLEENGIRLK